MPEIEMDPACSFITHSGAISYDRSNLAQLKSEIKAFMDALSADANLGSVIEEETMIRMSIDPSMYLFQLSVKDITANTLPKIVIDMENNSTVTLSNIFPGTEGYFLYWVIYKSKSMSMSSSLSTEDVFVSFAVGHGEFPIYQGGLQPEILNNMTMYTRWAFGIVSVVDSVYEGESPYGYRGIVIPKCSGGWVTDQSSDVGKKINATMEERISYVTESSSVDTPRTITSSLFITSDSPMYPSSGVKNGVFGNICPAIYMTPIWSPSSRCISVNSKSLQWGGLLDGTDDVASHYGPEYTSIGSEYFLHCLDLYVPVNSISST